MRIRLQKWLAATRHQKQRAGQLRQPFSGASKYKLLLLGVEHRIPQSQIYPFHYYAAEFQHALETEIREYPVETYGVTSDDQPSGATTVCFQTQFDVSADAVTQLISRIKKANPNARLVYLDWFAPTDLRLAGMLMPLVDLYVTKHVLRDRSIYGTVISGDTTLMDYYGRRYGLDHQETCFAAPDGFWDKTLVGPSFVTADFMLRQFDKGQLPDTPRPVDLHARIATDGTPWYAAMRGECAVAVAVLDGVKSVTGMGVRHDVFLKELRSSKICFSPFGYGEVCWRDYEAVMCGAVLLKQDMAHVETDPDIFVPGETYVPVKWDLSDFEEKVHWLLADADARRRISRNAFEVLQEYARSKRFVAQMAPLLG